MTARAGRRGPRALLAALGLVLGLAGSAQARTVDVWVAAVPVTWNVVPNGRDAIEGDRFPRSQTVFRAVVYRSFTPGWKRPIGDRTPPGVDNRGLQGPLIRAEVGDEIRVHFKNLDTAYHRPHSMHFHGVRYAPASDGSFVPGFSGRGANVPVNGTFTYRLTATPESVGVWPYHDHSPSMMDSIAGGLYGALSIRDPAEPRPDREFVVFLAETNGFSTIDGRAFVGNTPVFKSRVGDVVQWDVLTLGDDFHTFHVHGHRWLGPDGVPEDTRTIGPAESFRVRWTEADPGTWLYHCHVESHMMHGMIGLYRVSPR